jgi:hypothetical protein
MKGYRLTAWGVPAGAVLALFWGSALSPAQAPGAGAAKIYTNKTVFDLPVNIDERARGSLREVVLYVKVGQQPWAVAETVSPVQDRFRYKVTQDGEYWFSVVTVDRSGVSTPRDVSREPPGLMVVVDTQPPTCEIQMATLPGGQAALRCLVHDSCPDLQAIRVSAKGPDGSLRPLEPVPGRPGFFQVTPEILRGWIQVAAADRAGNRSTRDFNLRELTGQGPAVPPAPQQAAAPTLPTPGAEEATHTAARQAAVAGLSAPAPQAPLPTPSALPNTPQKPAADARPGSAPRQVINTKHASIDYRVDPVGPSGIGKVEVWMTADQGASWQKVGEDVDRRSPAEVDLPGEGLFGIRLVVSNGNGFGGAAPTANDAPHAWVEVDLSPPVAQLRDVEPHTKDGKLEIRWVVNDKNLTAEPISLYYATKKEGPWQPIARGLKNDGFHHWGFPHDAGNQFFVRLEATDQAGNVTRCETPMPVVLDMTEPHALVVGVTGLNPTPPQGH